MNQYEIDYKQGYDNANDEWLERIEKIRAEIKDSPSHMLSTSSEYERGVNAMLGQSLMIIDKYKAESEEEE